MFMLDALFPSEKQLFFFETLSAKQSLFSWIIPHFKLIPSKLFLKDTYILYSKFYWETFNNEYKNDFLGT